MNKPIAVVTNKNLPKFFKDYPLMKFNNLTELVNNIKSEELSSTVIDYENLSESDSDNLCRIATDYLSNDSAVLKFDLVNKRPSSEPSIFFTNKELNEIDMNVNIEGMDIRLIQIEDMQHPEYIKDLLFFMDIFSDGNDLYSLTYKSDYKHCVDNGVEWLSMTESKMFVGTPEEIVILLKDNWRFEGEFPEHVGLHYIKNNSEIKNQYGINKRNIYVNSFKDM